MPRQLPQTRQFAGPDIELLGYSSRNLSRSCVSAAAIAADSAARAWLGVVSAGAGVSTRPRIFPILPAGREPANRQPASGSGSSAPG